MERPRTHWTPRHALLLAGLAAGFVALGHGFVLQKRVDGPTRYLNLAGGDAAEYLAMVEGGPGDALPPFRYRVLVPFLAKVLPLPADQALRAISYASLFLAYLLLMATGLRLGLPPAAAVAGLLAVFASSLHLYNYFNPFLADAFQVAALSGMLYALVARSFPAFAVCAVLGVLARETTIYLVPVWLLVDRRQGTVLFLVTLVLLAMPRVLLGTLPGSSLAGSFQEHGLPRLARPWNLGWSYFWTWQLLWILALAGILLAPRAHFVSLAAAFVALSLGAGISTLVASDVGRMFTVLTPVLALASAVVFAELVQARRTGWALLLLGVQVAQGLVGMPNVVFGEEVFRGFWGAKRAVLAVSAACGVVTVFLLRHKIAKSWEALRRGPVLESVRPV